MQPSEIAHYALTSLSAGERLELAQELWASLHADEHAALFTDEQVAEIDRRIAEADADPANAEPWRSAIARLRTEF